MTKTEVIVLDNIYNFTVETFFILFHFKVSNTYFKSSKMNTKGMYITFGHK